MTTIAIVQSCYIPWKGYFDLINRSDKFILYDCVQYTSYDWRNRNQIKTQHGLHWLTIPVTHIAQSQRIIETVCADKEWPALHLKTLQRNYTKAPYFSEYFDAVEALYHQCPDTYLSEINHHFLSGINNILGIHTPLVTLREHIDDSGDKTDKLVAICKYFGATKYLSGPSAKTYLDFTKFDRAGIAIEWMEYDYPEYDQLYPPFIHEVSILDLLFHTGANAMNYITRRAET